VQLPQLEAEAATAAQEMQAAQQQAQDPAVTDEEREQLMERIPVLTTAEADLAQRLQTVREVLPHLQCCPHQQGRPLEMFCVLPLQFSLQSLLQRGPRNTHSNVQPASMVPLERRPGPGAHGIQ